MKSRERKSLSDCQLQVSL